MLLSKDELAKTSEMDPQIIEFVKNNPMPPIDWTDAPATAALMRAVSEQGLAMLGAPEASLTEEYKKIPMRDGFESTIKIHRPTQKPSGGSPLIVFCFGGGFISGDNDAGTGFARGWVRLFGAVAVNISYRLAPEHKFPISQYDGLDTMKWLSEHASEIGADPTKGFIVGGISAGGTESAVITCESVKDFKLAHPITGQWLSVPSIMDENNVPAKYKDYHHSLRQNKEVPVLPASALDALKVHIQFDDNSPMRWPVLYGNEVFSKLPPTYLQADGMDPLRDDALIYEEILKEAGVKTKIDLYPGAPHAHFALFPGIEISNRAVADIMVGMGWLLGKAVSPQEGLGAMLPAAS